MIIFEVLITMQFIIFQSSKSAIFSNRIATEIEKRRSIATGSKRQYQLQKNLLTRKKKQFKEPDKLRKSRRNQNLRIKEQESNDSINKQNNKKMRQFAEKMKENLDKDKSSKERRKPRR
jgi:hypothetical protein